MSSPWGLKARVKANPQTHMVNDASVVTVDMLLRVPRGLDERERTGRTCVSQYFLVSINIPEEIVLQNARTT